MGDILIDTKELYWLAGLLEGEGCIHIRIPKKGNPHLRITLEMTDKDILKRVQSIARWGLIYNERIRTRAGKPNKPIQRFELSRQEHVAGLLMTLYPIFGERRQAKVREALTMWRSVPYSGHSLGRGRW